MLEQIKKSYTNFYFCKRHLRENKEFIIKAININYLILTLIDEKLRYDYDILFAAVRKNAVTLLYVNHKISDIDFYQKCIDINPKSILYVPDVLQIKNALKAIKYDHKLFSLLPRESTRHRGVVITAINTNPNFNFDKKIQEYKYFGISICNFVQILKFF